MNYYKHSEFKQGLQDSAWCASNLFCLIYKVSTRNHACTCTNKVNYSPKQCFYKPKLLYLLIFWESMKG